MRLVGVRDPDSGAYCFYLINIAPEELDADELAQLHACRYQVELVFKELQSHYRLDELPTRKAAVVEALLLASVNTLLGSRTGTGVHVRRNTHRAHNCQGYSRHRSLKGVERLRIRNSRSWEHYRLECGWALVGRDLKKPEALFGELGSVKEEAETSAQVRHRIDLMIVVREPWKHVASVTEMGLNWTRIGREKCSNWIRSGHGIFVCH